jgi:hypothetical protein
MKLVMPPLHFTKLDVKGMQMLGEITDSKHMTVSRTGEKCRRNADRGRYLT